MGHYCLPAWWLVLWWPCRHQVLSEVPVNMLACSVFSIIIYWISNVQHRPDRFLVFWAMVGQHHTHRRQLYLSVRVVTSPRHPLGHPS